VRVPVSAEGIGSGGPVDQRIIVIGQSHVRALLEGYETMAGARWELPDGVEASFVVSRPDRVVLTSWKKDGFVRDKPKKSLSDVVAPVDPTRVVLAWGGNQMNMRALVATDRPFDVLLPSDDPQTPPDPGIELIPCSVIDGFVRKRLEGNDMLRELIIECARRSRPIAMLVPPPPLPERAVRERLGDEPHFVKVLEHLRRDATDVPIVPDPVRQRLWALMAGTYRSFATTNGLDVLEPPADSFDDRGMLAADCWGQDATHANATYGVSTLRTVFAWAAGPVPTPTVREPT
jgi:hypothetical protein